MVSSRSSKDTNGVKSGDGKVSVKGSTKSTTSIASVDKGARSNSSSRGGRSGSDSRSISGTGNDNVNGRESDRSSKLKPGGGDKLEQAVVVATVQEDKNDTLSTDLPLGFPPMRKIANNLFDII